MSDEMKFMLFIGLPFFVLFMLSMAYPAVFIPVIILFIFTIWFVYGRNRSNKENE